MSEQKEEIVKIPKSQLEAWIQEIKALRRKLFESEAPASHAQS